MKKLEIGDKMKLKLLLSFYNNGCNIDIKTIELNISKEDYDIYMFIRSSVEYLLSEYTNLLDHDDFI